MTEIQSPTAEVQRLLEHVESYYPRLLSNILRDLDTATGSNVNKTRYGAKALLETDLPLMIRYIRVLESAFCRNVCGKAGEHVSNCPKAQCQN